MSILEQKHPMDHSNFSDFYCNMNFFATANDYDIVAAVLLPERFGTDVEGLRIRSLQTGQVSGAVVTDRNSHWSRVYAGLLPPQVRIVQAKLTDFSTFRRDVDNTLHLPQDLHLEVVNASDKPIAEDFHFTWYSRCTLPLPAQPNIIRVAGDVGNDGFLLGGATWHNRLELLVRRHMGRETKDLERILDWGVGCGRIARHFLERGQRNIFGADIDDLNIQWLRSNFGWKDAIRVDFDPPMPYPDRHFDLVYAHSVLTHLSHADQFRWLEEIKRILKPGGMAFLTISTEAGFYLSRYEEKNKQIMDEYLRSGFVDVENQSHIGVDAGREGYYRLVFHTRKFITEKWGSILSVQRIVPCYYAFMDLVILRKARASEGAAC
jgi:ubiquinone/menaquinone biosynthesis C-methylase UbiE